MKMAILKLILWPKNKDKSRREVPFQMGKVNVITGDSQTGKSSIISIVDYCLGAQKCTIPVGRIRQTTEWFGLLVQLENSQMLIARTVPGNGGADGEFYITEKLVVDIPSYPHKNASLQALKTRLDQLSGLPSSDFAGVIESGYNRRASFRDLAAFQFQPQHIVANPNTLFFKADKTEHREKLKTILPVVLGSMPPESLEQRKNLEDLEDALKAKTRALDVKRKAIDAWQGQIKGQYLSAIEMGLVGSNAHPKADWTITTYLKALSTIPKKFDEVGALAPPQGITSSNVGRLVQLRSREEELAHQIGSLRHRLFQLEETSGTSVHFAQILLGQRDRMEAAGWFQKSLGNGKKCPFCESEASGIGDKILTLKETAEHIGAHSGQLLGDSRQRFDAALASTRKQLGELEAELSQVRSEIKILTDKDQSERSRRQLHSNAYRFIGALERNLSEYEAIYVDSDLQKQIDSIQKQIDELRKKVNTKKEQERLLGAIQTISKRMSFYLEKLQVESPEKKARLDPKELSIKIENDSGRDDYLWELGSGANYMGYHVSFMLALHEYLDSLTPNFVPSFLIVDQPSQVYFPERWPDDSEIANPKGKVSTDLKRVGAIFESLSVSVDRLRGKFQIIVIEHAPELTWKGLNNVVLAGRWRDGEALIPQDW